MTGGGERVDRADERRPDRRVALARAALTGVAGSALSIAAGGVAAAATMNPDEGATFVALWFWLAGPPASAAVIALMARRRWNRRDVRLRMAVAFVACVVCGLVALTVARPTSSPPPLDVPPPTTDVPPTTSG